MNTGERRVEVGRIVAVHGVRGGLKLESWTEPRTQIFEYRPWTPVLSDGSRRQCSGASGHRQGKGLLAALPEIEDREQALALVGARIEVPRAALPPPAAGEYYWADLEGLRVSNMDNVDLGRVDHVLATGANDVLALIDDAGRERLVPFVPDMVIKDVDLESGCLRVDWDPEF